MIELANFCLAGITSPNVYPPICTNLEKSTGENCYLKARNFLRDGQTDGESPRLVMLIKNNN